jgi:hypothetical protein
MTSQQFLDNYRITGFDKVEGWCGPKLFDVISLLDNVGINKAGGCLEIGVHHGKFYILLNSVIEENFKSFALDLFENQNLNIDRSGKGSLEAFRNNLKKYDRHNGSNTRIVMGDSTDPKVTSFFSDEKSYFRFISIDGGHTAEHTVSDLVLANELISNQGIVILDDILNYHWLGVIEGAVIFLSQKPTLVPVAIGHNKLIFSKLSYRSFYFNLFNNSKLKSKVVGFFGHQVVAL